MALLLYSLYAGAAYAIYTCLVIIYRLFFHPLAKFPGPKLAAATGWYTAYYDIFVRPGGQVMFELQRLHRIYGPIIRISPEEIHVDDYTWLETLYSSSSGAIRDKHVPDAVMVGTPGAIFGTVDHHIHRIRRQAYSGLFSKSTASTAEPMIWEKTAKLIANIDEEIRREGCAEMRHHTLAYSTDIIAAFCLEESLWLQEDEDKARNWSTVQASVPDVIPVARNFSWIIPLSLRIPPWVLAKLDPGLFRVLSIRTEAEKQAKTAIKAYKADPNPDYVAPEHQNNIFRTIVTNKRLPESEKTFDRLGEEAWGILVAGGDTTAKAIANITFFLLQNRGAVLRELRDEVMAVMPEPSSRPSFKTLERLSLLTAVIKETLRTHGPVTSRLPLVSPKEDLVYNNWVIPAGYPVSMSPVDVMNDPRVFDEPYKWYPKRWLVNDEAKLELMNKNFIPFGRGSRACVGQNMAWIELYIAVAAIVRRTEYDLHDTTRERDVDFKRDCLVGQADPSSQGVRIKFRE